MTLPATEHHDPRYDALDTWDVSTVLGALWEGQMAAVAALRPALPALARAVEAASGRLRTGGRLVYAGAGTSGRIAVQDGAELAPTFDWPEDRLVLLMAGGPNALLRAVENAEDLTDTARAEIAAHGIRAGDVVLGVAASGATAFTIACVTEARARGALTIGIANSRGKLLEAAELAVLIETGAEAIAGSTRMKAGTAQKAALNLFSTALMVRLGRTYRGRMVDMVARNAKLHRRAERMLAEIVPASPERVQAALALAGGKVKLAALILSGLDPASAEAALARHHGHLRPALEEVRR